MIDVVMSLVVCLLEADDAVHAVVRELSVVVGGERHHLNLDVGEILLGKVNRLGKVRHASLGRMFSCDQENIFKRGKLLYGLILILYLLGREDGTCHRVFAMESAVDT